MGFFDLQFNKWLMLYEERIVNEIPMQLINDFYLFQLEIQHGQSYEQ